MVTLTEVIVIVIGLIAVIASFCVSDQVSVNSESLKAEEEALKKLTEGKESLQKWMQDAEEKVQSETEKRLSHISNEKIMGMKEYSNQILDKMEQNHGEVVFLYNMLNEKEEEIKKLVHEVDVQKADCQNGEVEQFQKLEELIQQAKQLQQSLEVQSLTANKETKHQYTSNASQVQSSEHKYMKPSKQNKRRNKVTSRSHTGDETVKQKKQPSVYDAEIAKIEAEEEKMQQEKQNDKISKNSLLESQDNHNEAILSLYKKGKSVLEISKMLSLGQGEVKFVIDLYHSK